MGYGKLERALGHSIGPLGASHLLGAALASTVLLIAGCGSVDSEERAHELGTVVQRALLGECESRIYQAEEMVHTTGEGTSDGWNLWSNGSSSVNHTFVTAQTTIVVRARGSAAAGVWPQMAVSVGGVQVGSVFVSTSSYAEYSFTFASTAGVQPLQISFTNDAYQNGEDRNLYLDWLSVECDATGEPSCSDGLYNGDEVGVDCGGSCAPCAACSPASHEAEGISATTGGATSDGWNIWSNGSIYTVHHFVSPATVEVVARGSYAGGGWPIMEVSVGGSVVGTATVASDVYGTYGFDYSGPLGSQELRVRFTNDYYQRPDDRNLYVDRVDITCPTECPSGSEGQPCSGGFCDANGECVECLSATDCDDGNECTSDACSGGTCNAVPTAGSSCQVGAGVCDAFGGCVEPASCDLGLTGPGIIDGDYVVDQVDTATDLAGLADVWCVTGNLSIKSTSLATLDDLSGLVAVGRNLWVFSNPDLVALTGLENLRRVYRLDVQQNAHIQDLNALQDLSATAVNVGNNAALSSLVGLSGVQGWLQALSVSQCPSLLTLEGLEGITEVNTLSISNNTNLQSLSALGGLTRVEFDALFINNDALNNLAGLESLAKVGRDFRVSQSENLASISQLTSLTDFGQWGGELLFFDNPRLPECEVQSLAGTLAASCANCSGNLLCDDGSECTTGACNGAACEHTLIVGSSCAAGGLCNEAGACVDCLDASDCADGDVCNGEESCDGSGSCVSGPPLDCSDGEECTADSCEPGLGCQNPIAVGQECSVGICSEFGACVECLEDSDCGAEEALALCDEAGSCQVLDCTPGASGPGIVDGTVIVDGEDTAGDLALLEGASCVTGDLYVTETLLTDLTGLSALRAVAGDFTIGGVIPGCTKYPCASGNKALVSLAGLENLQSVRGEFEVDHSPIRSLAALTALRHVGKIIVSDTAVQDLRGLEGLQHVAGSVGIYTNTQLTSVSGLDNLETVGQVVSLYGNRRLRSIAALGSLGSIGKSLGIFNSALTNLEGLESLTTVSSLGLHLNSSLVDIGALANLLVVDNLSLVNSPNLADLSVLGSITRLNELLLGDLGITNLSALQSLQQVGGLYVYDNAHLTSLDGLSALDSAPTVYIERNPVLVDVAAISHVPLELLIWSGNASITSLPALGYHSQSSLWIGEPEQPQALTDLAGLAGVTSIAALDLSATDSLNSLLGAESLTSIGRLSIQRCPNLTSLRGLENLQTLESLWVQANPDLTSLAALQSITALRELHVEYNPELESLAGLDALGPGSVGSMWIFGNASLPQCEVDAFVLGLDRWCDDCCCNDATSVCE